MTVGEKQITTESGRYTVAIAPIASGNTGCAPLDAAHAEVQIENFATVGDYAGCMSSVPRRIANDIATSPAVDATPVGYGRQIKLAYWAGALMLGAAIWAAILL